MVAPTATPAYEKMSLTQRVGQLFIWTYPGSHLNPQSEKWLKQYQPGALIVFSRNIQSHRQIAQLNSDLQKFASHNLKAPFFLMIDEEGGNVTRLKSSVPLPSALALGQMNDLEFTKRFGNAVGSLILSFGFNVNLAPVLDISNPERDTFIGSRAFGDSPEYVAKTASAFAEGLSESGVLPTAKHFPGHGGISQDSHQTLPKKLASLDELQAKDLIPFQEYSHAQFPRALMMAHLALPNIDPSGGPATYSNVMIQELLRGRLNYKGLILTDDLEMNGASVEANIGERAVRAFLAGNDMLMLAGSPSHQKIAFQAVLKAVKAGRISQARLKESVGRILDLKQTLKIETFHFDEKVAKTSIASIDSLSRQVLKHNFTAAIEGSPNRWPTVDGTSKVLILGSDAKLQQSFQKGFRGKTEFFQLTPKSLPLVARQLAKDDYQFAVYYASGVQTARWLNQLPIERRSKLIVINTNQEGEVQNQAGFLAVLNINSHDPECGEHLAQFLGENKGRTPAQESKSPVNED